MCKVKDDSKPGVLSPQYCPTLILTKKYSRLIKYWDPFEKDNLNQVKGVKWSPSLAKKVRFLNGIWILISWQG